METSWEDLVDQRGDLLLRVAFRVLHDIHDAEDIVQQVLLETFASGRMHDVGLMKRMTVFRSIDRLRRRISATPFDETVHVRQTTGERSRMEREESANQLRCAITKLPMRQAQCFWMRYVEGMSVRDIAASQTITESAVTTALSKARVTLKKCLQHNAVQSHD